MRYAATGVKRFEDADGDIIVLKEQPTGSQYDERVKMLGTMRLPGNLIDENANMQDMFKHGEMIEINMDKGVLAEFQMKSLFISATLNGRIIERLSEFMPEYRKFDLSTKKWVDEQVDSIWKEHDDEVKTLSSEEGNSETSSHLSSVEALPASDV